VYGVLYVVVEIVGYQLGQVGWVDISAMDVATAVTDACLAVSLALAALLGAKLAVQRWGATVRSWWDALGHPEVVWDDVDAPSGGWRPAPLTVTAERVEAPPERPYAGNPYSFGGHRWPVDRGRQL
jgi:hypothetical protein